MRRESVARVAALAGDGAAGPLGRAALRQFWPLAGALFVLYLLDDRIAAIDLPAVAAALMRITPLQWIAATAATFVSFRALGQYDAVIHRHLGTGIGGAEAGRAGITAIAISQVLGFGLVTGALVRWRMLPGLNLRQATRLTATVTGAFLAGWAVVAALAVLVLPAGAGPLSGLWAKAAAAGLLAVLAGATALAVAGPRLRLCGRSVGLPPLPALARLLLLTAVDTVAAALALWALLPAGVAVAPEMVVAAYLVALGAALVLATPGGLGPFEVALLALLPGIGEDGLLATILGFRMVYFAAPALVALGLLARGPGKAAARAAVPLLVPPATLTRPDLAGMVARAARAESAILRQGEHSVLLSQDGRNGWVVGRGSQALVALFDPFLPGRGTGALVAALAAAARAGDRIPCLYKCSARSAAVARRMGWTVAPVAEEHWLSPAEAAGFGGPDHAGLRRKLRKAAKAGVTVREAGPEALPLAEMARISHRWARVRGGERGFSMGRWAPGYVAGQRVYLAHAGGRLVAFASFHEGAREWVLDLMRISAEAPCGTMQALVAEAIGDASAIGVARLSLAALPCRAEAFTGLEARLRRRMERAPGVAGLARFKAGFAPRRERLYIAAPSRAALLVAALDIAREIHMPAPLCGGAGPGGDAILTHRSHAAPPATAACRRRIAAICRRASTSCRRSV